MMEELTAAEEAKKIIDGFPYHHLITRPSWQRFVRRMTWLEEQRRQPHQAPVL
jgi:hypothetical protein